MPWPVTINGRTYTAAHFAPYAYVENFPSIMQDVADIGAAANTIVSGVNFGNSFRNRLRNGNFTVNQRAVSGSVTLAAGAYGPDGFKGGASGCTYTFARANGVTTLTITAGSLVQVIEGAMYLPEGGQHTLSWFGTAQGRVNGAAYAASPVTVNLAAEANTILEWGTGTLSLPMFEPGTKRTIFERRDDEFDRCLRYYERLTDPGRLQLGGTINTTTTDSLIIIQYKKTKRANPTFTASPPSTFRLLGNGTGYGVNAVNAPEGAGLNYCYVRVASSGLVVGQSLIFQAGDGPTETPYLAFSAEL